MPSRRCSFLTKADKVNRQEPWLHSGYRRQLGLALPPLLTSAQSGQGIAELRAAVARSGGRAGRHRRLGAETGNGGDAHHGDRRVHQEPRRVALLGDRHQHRVLRRRQHRTSFLARKSKLLKPIASGLKLILLFMDSRRSCSSARGALPGSPSI